MARCDNQSLCNVIKQGLIACFSRHLNLLSESKSRQVFEVLCTCDKVMKFFLKNCFVFFFFYYFYYFYYYY